MWYDDYKMGFQQGVPQARYRRYISGSMDTWEIVVFYQDMLEAECVPMPHVDQATHFIEQRLVYFGGRLMQ